MPYVSDFISFETLLIIYPSFDGKEYKSVKPSKYSHKWTDGLANYDGKALTSGCLPSNVHFDCKFKTEVLDMTTMTWSDQPDYPIEFSDPNRENNYLCGYSTVSISDAAYIIGGVRTQHIIAEFRNGQWRQLENLKTRRSSHGSFTVKNRVFVLGGWYISPDHKRDK